MFALVRYLKHVRRNYQHFRQELDELMKTTNFFFLVALVSQVVAADHILTIGGQSFPVKFEEEGLTAEFRQIVTTDMEKVFAPLLDITNVLDITQMGQITNGNIPLIAKDIPTYPEYFSRGISMSIEHGTNVFVVTRSLSNLYSEKLLEINSMTNLLALLDSTIMDIRSGAVTNRSESEKMSLLYIPSESIFVNTEENANNLAASLVLTMPFPASLLEVFQMNIQGSSYWLVPTKSTVVGPSGVQTSFFLWICDGGQWKVFIPSSLDD